MRRDARINRSSTPAPPVAPRRAVRGGLGARLIFALLVLIALAPAAAAQTSTYHIRGNASAGSNSIWAINPTTGAETLVYNGYPGGNAATLAQRPSDGMLFYVINSDAGENGAVYRFNPATPSVAPVLLGNIGPSTSGGDVSSGFRMAFNAAGTLYYMSGGGGADNDRLYTVNQTTGRATPTVNITGTGSGGDMAFSSTGTLYIINQNRQLYSATTAGGAATSLGTVTFPGGATPGTIGLGVDGSRILITTTTTTSNLYAVTLPSLAASNVGSLSGGTVATGDLSTATITAPSLSVTKTDGLTNVYQGLGVTYTVVVTNSGTYAVTATVTDNIPAGLTGATWTCVASAGSSCAAASGSGNISTTATLAASGTATYTINATVAASSGTIANTVTATPPAWITDASPTNNTATDTDTVVAAADLSITKATSSTFTVGSNATYTLTARNTGPQSAAGTITVTDVLPAGLTYVSATGTGWTCGASGQTVTCTRSGPVTSGTTLPAITLTVAVGAAAAPSVTNTASVASNTTLDPDSSDNSSSVTSSVTVPPDLTIAKSHTGNFTQGQSGTYTITVTNSGGLASSGTVTVTDTLPAGLTPGTATGTGWTCNTAGQTVTCTRSTALAAGASYPAISVPVTVAPNSALSLTNTATVAGGGQTNTSNDSASDPTTINGVADLTIDKTHTGNFSQGQNGIYTLAVSNEGGAATSGTVTVTDTLPAGLTYVSATGTGWTCGASGQTVTCTRSTALAAGANYPAITLTVSVAPTAALSLTNTATVAGGGQTNTSNDSASDPTTVNGVADLTIVKTHTGNFTRGTTGTYTLTVSNTGGAATGGLVTVTDTLPAGLTPSTQSGTGWACGALGQLITCTRLDALAAGASYPAITIVVNVSQTAASSLTNTGTVAGGGQTNTSNDSDGDPTTVVSSADLSLAKTVNNPNPIQGQNVTFTLTLTNSGPSNATNVVVTDLLPAGLTYVSATPSAGTYTSGTGAWAVASLASGANVTLQIVTLVSGTGTITNTAEVTASDQPDPDSTPNNNNNPAEDDRASASVGAAAPPNITLTKSVTPSGTQVPGTQITYTVAFANVGGTPASAFVLTDPNPATTLKINDYTDFKVGSVVNTLGTTGLTVTVAYSNDNGSTWTYTPTSAAGGAPAGFDRNVTHIRWTFTGSLSQTAPNNSGSVSFTTRIR